MTKTSPSADRAVRIVEYLAHHPERSFGLAELTRRLGLSHATAHALLATLVEHGWVRRDTGDRTFSLGPALVPVGLAARRALRVVDEAVPHLEALAAELGQEVHAGIAVADEVMVVARAGPPPPFGMGLEVGQRMPLRPPLGAPYVAWSGPADVDAYLARGGDLTDEERARYRAALAAVRRRGYAVTLDADSRRRLGEVAARLAEGAADPDLVEELGEVVRTLAHEEYLLVDTDGSGEHDVLGIWAPVFGPDGGVALVLGFLGFGRRLSAVQIPAYAGRLLEATAAVTRAIHGRPPA